MKILLMYPSLHSSPSRAREILSSTIVNALSEKHEIIYGGLTNDSVENISSKYNIETVYDHFDLVRKSKLALFFYTIHFLFKNQVDVIYERATHLPIGLFLSIFLKKKYVTDAHLLSVNSTSQTKKYNYFYRLLDSLRFNFSSLIVANFYSQSQAIKLVKGKTYNHLVNVGPYVDSIKFSPKSSISSKAKLGIKEDFICYVGSFDKDHKPEYILPAFKLISEQYSNIKLYMVGSGPNLKSIKMQTEELGILNRVKFTGRVDNSLVPFYINGSIFCINPTITQRNKIVGMIGDKSLEYASCGKVQIVPSLKGIPVELVKVNAAIAVGDTSLPENIAKAAMFLIENEELRERMNNNSRFKIEDGWNLFSFKTKLLDSVSALDE